MEDEEEDEEDIGTESYQEKDKLTLEETRIYEQAAKSAAPIIGINPLIIGDYLNKKYIEDLPITLDSFDN